MTRRNLAEWTDARGVYQATKWNQVDGSTPTALLTALQAHSAMGLTQQVEGPLSIVNDVPTGTVYSTSDVWAVLTFCTAAGKLVKLKLHAPAMGIFLAADRSQVDPTQIDDIIVAALGTLSDPAGNPVTSYRGGVRVSSSEEDF
jgi:hypothetical protein